MPLNLQSRAVRVVIAALIAALGAVAIPTGDLWLKCQQPASEACVWGKAYLPVSVAISCAIVGVPVFLVALALLKRYAATRGR